MSASSHEKRQQLRSISTVSDFVRESLQKRCLDDDLIYINTLVESTRSTRKRDSYLGMIAILEYMLADTAQGISSFMAFQEAYDLFMAYQDTTSYSKETFRDKLLHPEEGIAVCYVVHPTTGERYLVLRPHHINMENFLVQLTDDF